MASPEAANSICPEILLVIHPGKGCMGCIMPKAGSIMKWLGCGADGWDGLDNLLCCIVKIGALGLRLLAFCCCSAIGENFMLCMRDTFLRGAADWEGSEPIIICGGSIPWL
jgi:hypothetical protein